MKYETSKEINPHPPAQAERPSLIVGHIQQIEQNLAHLEQSVEMLHGKLSIVMLPSSPPIQSDQNDMPEASSIGTDLLRISDRLQNSTKGLEDIYSRLEI